jgi:phosphoenolpyruvate carboxykinase (ATP)
VFGLEIPRHVPGVPDSVLDPRGTWPDGTAYDKQAAKLAGMFRDNFAKYEGGVSDAVRAAGPKSA